MFKVGKSGERNAPQDRMNVTKAGQSRGLSDTKVYFATQNGIGSDMIINAAARNQYFIEHKEQLQKAMNDLYVADSIYRSAIAKMKAEACKDEDPDADADSEACAAAKAKSTDQYLAENPELKKAKDDADAIAAALTAKLREDNKNGLILEADLDAADSPVNFDRQVSVLRSMLASQIDLIKSSIAMLKAADREQLDTVISLVVSGLKRFQKQNQQMEAVQLIAAGFNFVGEVGKAKDLEVKINSNLTITGYMLARVMMNTAKIENTLDQQLTYIDGLATYTGMVDPDSVLQ
jgi:type III secretion system FlhB-like substrate exporter